MKNVTKDDRAIIIACINKLRDNPGQKLSQKEFLKKKRASLEHLEMVAFAIDLLVDLDIIEYSVSKQRYDLKLNEFGK